MMRSREGMGGRELREGDTNERSHGRAAHATQSLHGRGARATEWVGSSIICAAEDEAMGSDGCVPERGGRNRVIGSGS
jgi:hypothetical protein